MKNLLTAILRGPLGLFLAAIPLCAAYGQDIVVNEFMAQNAGTLTNKLGVTADWIELYNQGDSPIDLGGWYLTDNLGNRNKCQLPSTNLAPDAYLLVFADGNHTGIISGEIYVDFALSDGEPVALVQPDGNTIHHALPATNHTDNVSFGILADMLTTGYFDIPTPGSPNSIGNLGFADPPLFSHASAAYTNGFQLELSVTSTTAFICYTLDGTTPTTNKTKYRTPIAISGGSSTLVRARTYQTNMVPSSIISCGYAMVDASLTNFSSDVPIVLMETFGFNFETNRTTRAWEPLYLIVIDTNGTGRAVITDRPVFAGRGAVHGRGASSYSFPKIDLAIETLSENNTDKDVSFFGLPADSDWILYGPDYAYFSDPSLGHSVFLFNLYRQMGHYAPRTRYVELFMNADMDKFELENGFTGNDYNGVYVWMEKVKQGKDRVNIKTVGAADTNEPAITGGYIIKREQGVGDFTAAEELLMYYYPDPADMTGPMSAQAAWLRSHISEFGNVLNSTVSGYTNYIDLSSWLDFHLLIGFGQIHDLMTKSRYTYKDRGGKLVMGPPWDCDGSLDLYPTAGWDGGFDGGGAGMWDTSWWNKNTGLLEDPDFWQKWIDRYFELRQDVFSVSNLVALADSMSNEVWEAHFRNAERWSGGSYPHYQAWLQQRVAWMDSAFTAPPVFNQNGGMIASGFELVIAPSPNTVYYTTNGLDPYASGGVLAPGAMAYSSPIPLTQNTLVKARGWTGQAWTGPPHAPWGALAEAVFVVNAPTVSVTEVMYNPRDPVPAEKGTNLWTSDDYEFIEIRNTGTGPASLLGVRLTDGLEFNFSFGARTTLDTGEHAVVVKNLAAFKLRYPDWAGMNIVGQYEGNLNNGGERIMLEGPVPGQTNSAFTYGDGRDWPLAADGAGHSLVPLTMTNQAAGSLSYGGNWRASAYIDGSPGAADPAPARDVVLNEIVAHTDYTNPAMPEYDSNDKIELYNTTTLPVTFDCWYLSDDAADLKKWRIPVTNVIGGQGFLTFDEISGFHNPITNGFGLFKGGEQVFLSYLPGTAQDRVADCVEFKGQENGLCLGRYPDGGLYWYALQPTSNAINSLPAKRILINEIMYHPAPTAEHPEDNTADEFLELCNPTTSNVLLMGECGPDRIRGEIEYTFPPGTVIPPGRCLVLVPFDPTNTAAWASFCEVYSMETNRQILICGPHSGKLSNRGGRIALEKSLAPDLPGEQIAWIIVDEVIYANQAPWPASADGTGSSIRRKISAASGSDPTLWVARAPAPGMLDDKAIIIDPEGGAVFYLPFTAQVNVAVDSYYVSGAVSRVDFKVDRAQFGSDSNAPYTATLSTITNTGDYGLSAVVWDDGGAWTTRITTIAVYGVPTVENGTTAGWITDFSADFTGNVTTGGIVDAYVYWGESDCGTNAGAWAHCEYAGRLHQGPFTYRTLALAANRTYYYRCCVTNPSGVAWAPATASFKTQAYSDWAHRMKITFTGYTKPGTLTNFPALVLLGTNVAGFSYGDFAYTTADDLRFLESTQTAPLNYEIESWAPSAGSGQDTGGTSRVWVQVPTLSGTNTSIWACWGNAVTLEPPYRNNGSTWSEGYRAVCHMGVLADSTSNGVLLVNHGSSSADGLVARSRYFDGNGDYVEPQLDRMWYSNNLGRMTVSLWARPEGGALGTVFGSHTNDVAKASRRFHIRIAGTKWEFGLRTGYNQDHVCDSNQWQMLSMVMATNRVYVYKNGIVSPGAMTNAVFAPDFVPTIGWMNGADLEAFRYRGLMDEFTISTTNRSADWLWACWMNQGASNGVFQGYEMTSNAPAIVDDDHDGMADVWEVSYFGGTNASGGDASEDRDSDGLSNLKEYIAGTDPTTNASRLTVEIGRASGNLAILFSTIEATGTAYSGKARYYDLEDSSNLPPNSWSIVSGQSNIQGNGSQKQFTNLPPAELRRFYRVKARLLP